MEIYVNSTKLTFLKFLYKIDIEMSKEFQQRRMLISIVLCRAIFKVEEVIFSIFTFPNLAGIQIFGWVGGG